MLNYKQLVSPALLLSYPQFKMVDGVNMKLVFFNMTNDGPVPIYEETDEVSEQQALEILMGGAT